MSTWSRDELDKIAAADELELASLRTDGTLRKPVTIWVARVGDNLFVRSVNGSPASWYRGTQANHKGHIWAGGVEKDVTFVDVGDDPGLEAQIDAAYRGKYRRYAASIVNSVLTSQARAATLQLVPRS